MRRELLWTVAGVGLLAVPVALPSEAGAATGPMPRECQLPNLSAEAQARCDFIARTPDICLRTGLSEATQRFCDELGEEPTPGITISPDVPADIPGGAGEATLADAANFA
jgi:hypothetical protein